MSKETFPLWMFEDGQRLVTTRGRTQQEAWSHAQRTWPRGRTVVHCDYCLIDAARIYSINHAPGWLFRPPVWLQQQRTQQSQALLTDGRFDMKRFTSDFDRIFGAP